MKARLLKLRRTGEKRLNKGMRNLEGVTISHAHRFIISRWNNLREVRKYATGWVIFVSLLAIAAFWQSGQLSQLYAADVPSKDTTYNEGVFGTVENFNPIFASTPAERSVSRLLFANLLTYDDRNELVGELAQTWSVDDSGKIYTLTLRPNLHWHDGMPITAKDVLFTFNTIKKVDAKSPLYSSWAPIGVEKVNDLTVKFTLPVPLAAFPNSLVLGILPEHILSKLLPSEMRNNNYNRFPRVASGPFMIQDVHAVDVSSGQYEVRMTANDDYFRGAPKLSAFNLHSYADREQLLSAYRSQEVSAVSDLSTQQLASLGKPSDTLIAESPLYDAVYAFLKTSNPILQDVKVRQALEMALNGSKIIDKLGRRVNQARGPLLPSQLGYRDEVHQADFNPDRAAQLLEDAGWKKGADGKRSKDGKPLKLQLVTVSSGDYPIVIQEIMDQWLKIGVSFDAQLVRADDFQQNIIIPRAYDVLIYDISLGRDSDVFAYWDSSQATDRGFNLSDYKSAKVDDALEGARSRLDPALREAKYHTFVQQWITDVPAIALYQPSFSYVQTKNVTSFQQRPLVDPVTRYYNVIDWSAEKELLRPTR